MSLTTALLGHVDHECPNRPPTARDSTEGVRKHWSRGALNGLITIELSRSDTGTARPSVRAYRGQRTGED
jgi:hypothetical protein